MDFAQWLGLGAITGVVAAFWNQLLGAWQLARSRVIVQFTASGYIAAAIRVYTRDKMQASRFGNRMYTARLLYVKPRSRWEPVELENPAGDGVRVFWRGWRPLWMTADNSIDFAPCEPVKVSFVRGTFDAEQLCIDAMAHWKESCFHLGQQKVDNIARRFNVTVASGSRGSARLVHVSQGGSNSDPSSDRRPVRSTSDMGDSFLNFRPLSLSLHDVADIWSDHRPPQEAIESMWLNEAATAAFREVGHWLQAKEWCEKRAVPWKRGYLLDGPPGVGKTTFIRAIGQFYDMPVRVFDLNTFTNREFRQEWHDSLIAAPCINVIEDIDGTFDGRKNVNAHDDDGSALTYDTLINAIDGISKADGILLFITTNRIGLLDDAMVRPGRIDRIVRFTPPDRDGRLKIAGRILADWPDVIEQAVNECDGLSGAELEEHCKRIAFDRFWRDHDGPASTNHGRPTAGPAEEKPAEESAARV